MSQEKLPGKGLLGWLGRQVGYVAKAVQHDPAVVAEREQIEEKTDPEHPGLVFRRTVRDEVRRGPTDRPTGAQAEGEPTDYDQIP
jgi:hypothetical protein